MKDSGLGWIRLLRPQTLLSILAGVIVVGLVASNLMDQLKEKTSQETTMPVTGQAVCEDIEGEGPEMVVIEAGGFTMGSPDTEAERESNEGPQHEVMLARPFAMSRCEVTVGEFRRFVKETGYSTDAEKGQGCGALNEAGDKVEPRSDRSWRNPGFQQSDNHPVVCVSWNDAQAYIEWLSIRTGQVYRLPTEAEWEYLARAGTATPFSTGECINTDQANYNGNFDYAGCGAKTGLLRNGTIPTGSLPPNPWGLHEVHGNVWEWVLDCWHDDYEGAPKDGAVWQEGGDCFMYVYRGGGWNAIPGNLRSAFRFRYPSEGADAFLGFRLARSL